MGALFSVGFFLINSGEESLSLVFGDLESLGLNLGLKTFLPSLKVM